MTPLPLDLSDLFILRSGWIETLSAIANDPDVCEDCAPSVEECLERLSVIQEAIRTTEERIAVVESHERNASKRAN